jgi:hypothetical protein
LEALGVDFGLPQEDLARARIQQRGMEVSHMGRAARGALKAKPEEVDKQAARVRRQLKAAGVSEDKIETVMSRFTQNLAAAASDRSGAFGLGAAEGFRATDVQTALIEAASGVEGVDTGKLSGIAMGATGDLLGVAVTTGPEVIKEQVEANRAQGEEQVTARAKGQGELVVADKADLDKALGRIGLSSLEDSSKAEIEAQKILAELSPEEAILLSLYADDNEEEARKFIDSFQEDDPKTYEILRKPSTKDRLKKKLRGKSDDVKAALAKVGSTMPSKSVGEVSKFGGGPDSKFGPKVKQRPGLQTVEGRKAAVARVKAVKEGQGVRVRSQAEDAYRSAFTEAGISLKEGATLEEMASAYTAASDEQRAKLDKIGSAGALFEELAGDVSAERGEDITMSLIEEGIKPTTGATRADPGAGLGGAPTKEMKDLEASISEMNQLAARQQGAAAEDFRGSVANFDKAVKELRSMDLMEMVRKMQDD